MNPADESQPTIDRNSFALASFQPSRARDAVQHCNHRYPFTVLFVPERNYRKLAKEIHLMQTQSLSFEVRFARTRQDLQAACRVRAQSYGHHLPHLHSMLLEPDLLDADEHTHVVLCVDKASGSAVGTARFQTNAGGPLLIEHSVRVPEAMQSDTRAEVTRLSAVAGADPLVKLAMMKASYLFCMATQVRWMVICARSEAFVRQYKRLGFTDIHADGRLIPMLHVGRLPHHVLTFNVTGAESRWRAERHALYDFMIETAHPDIQLFSRQPALPQRDQARRVDQLSAWDAAPRRSRVAGAPVRAKPVVGSTLVN